MKAVLITYNPMQAGQQALAAYLDTRHEVKNWYMPYAGAAIVVVDDVTSPSSLSWVIRTGFPALEFAIASVNSFQLQGWMPQPFWDMVNNPSSSGHSPNAPSVAAILKAIADKKKEQ